MRNEQWASSFSSSSPRWRNRIERKVVILPTIGVGPSIIQSVSIPSVSEVKPQTVPVSVPHPSPPLSPPIPTMDKDRVVICEPSPYWPTSKTEIDTILSKNLWNTAWPPGKVATPLSYLGNVFEALLGTWNWDAGCLDVFHFNDITVMFFNIIMLFVLFIIFAVTVL